MRPEDRAAVRRICAATAWMGEPSPERIADEWIWSEFWTRYFADRERRSSWVVERAGDGRVVGYLTGTADVRRFDRYGLFLLPGIVLRVIRRRLIRRRASRRAILSLLRSVSAGELDLPRGIAGEYPATFHANLLAEARGCGSGSALLGAFLDRMRSMGAPGVHAQPLSVNRPVQRLLRRAGFRCVAGRPLHAFAHVDARPIEVLTCVLRLGKGVRNLFASPPA